jgi:hypothetical protein
MESITRAKELRNRLRDQSNRLINDLLFNIQEQELIRRVFKVVLPQIKGDTDRNTACDILHKTEWLDE